MKKLLHNDHGYTLVFTVGIIVIFMVLGLSLMMLTSSGIKKNEVRQDTVQSKDLADKGITYAVNDLQSYLEKTIKNTPMGKTQFNDLLNNTVKVTCPQNIIIPGEKNNKTNVCIEKVEQISTVEQDRYKRLVTFKSTGQVNGRDTIVRSKVIIGTDAIPDQLRYAVSTNKGGNLFLHGGVEIQGDIKTDGNLIISKNATWMSGSTAKWEDSVGARIVKETKSVNPKIIMRDKDQMIYTIDGSSSTVNYNSHIAGSFNNNYGKISPYLSNSAPLVEKKLFNTQNLAIVTKSLTPDNINVITKVEDKINESADYNYYDGDVSITSTNNPIKNYTRDKTILIAKKEKKSSFSFSCFCWREEETGKYLKANLTINVNSNINLRGSYYINGDLSITNTNLKSDAIIYVKGDVNIRDSTLMGIDPNSTLIIFADGNISISNISEYSSYNNPSTIKGFFYSNSDMIMYGVGSNIRLTGGISSRRLILTALRGDVSTTTKPISIQNKLDVNGFPVYPSRLKVTYDENLIKQYTSFQRDEKEEFITQLNEPEYIERSNN